LLFNSYAFIFAFFPVTLAGYFFWGCQKKQRIANIWLVLASFLFYGYWNVKYLPLLVGSIAVNYLVSGRIIAAREKGMDGRRKAFFLLGLLFNLSLLGYYKYLNFFLDIVNQLGAQISLLDILLPFGISFFTITQILYLLDCNEGVTKEHDIVNYALFVSFFPHLLSGPILYHKPMMQQFRDESLLHVNWENMARGLALFVIGLVKKVLIADTLSGFVGTGFGHAGSLAVLPAWLTAVAYMMQLYYDFSGYSDMAVGMSRMMNIKIPINFNSPYRAGSLILFWQRWHMSLTNALTGCLYMPLVRSFRSPSFWHTILAVFIVFFIVGIWHGAGWNYVIFALMHSVGMVVNHVWKHYHLWMPKFLGHLLTLGYVLVSMVFFRAADVSGAVRLLSDMAGRHGGFDWPVSEVGQTVVIQTFGLPLWTFLVAVALVIWCPNSNELVKKRQPSFFAALAVAILLAASVCMLHQPTEFLYLQF